MSIHQLTALAGTASKPYLLRGNQQVTARSQHRAALPGGPRAPRTLSLCPGEGRGGAREGPGPVVEAGWSPPTHCSRLGARDRPRCSSLPGEGALKAPRNASPGGKGLHPKPPHLGKKLSLRWKDGRLFFLLCLFFFFSASLQNIF